LQYDKAVDGIWCLFKNILKKISGFVFDFLGQMVGKVVSIPICAVESFIGSMMQTIGNEIANAIGPILQEFNICCWRNCGSNFRVYCKGNHLCKRPFFHSFHVKMGNARNNLIMR